MKCDASKAEGYITQAVYIVQSVIILEFSVLSLAHLCRMVRDWSVIGGKIFSIWLIIN